MSRVIPVCPQIECLTLLKKDPEASELDVKLKTDDHGDVNTLSKKIYKIQSEKEKGTEEFHPKSGGIKITKRDYIMIRENSFVVVIDF